MPPQVFHRLVRDFQVQGTQGGEALRSEKPSSHWGLLRQKRASSLITVHMSDGEMRDLLGKSHCRGGRFLRTHFVAADGRLVYYPFFGTMQITFDALPESSGAKGQKPGGAGRSRSVLRRLLG